MPNYHTKLSPPLGDHRQLTPASSWLTEGLCRLHRSANTTKLP